jgi:hypothetical protein
VLTLGDSGRILIAVEPVDGRQEIDSHAGVVRSVRQGDPLSGDLFVFENRRGRHLSNPTFGYRQRLNRSAARDRARRAAAGS